MEGESAIVGSDKICGAAAPGTVARDQIDSLIALSSSGGVAQPVIRKKKAVIRLKIKKRFPFILLPPFVCARVIL